MSKVLIIGAGGVGSVVAHKCAQVPEVFSDICLASRTVSKCEDIAAQITKPIRTEHVDADNVPELVSLIRDFNPELIINVRQEWITLTRQTMNRRMRPSSVTNGSGSITTVSGKKALWHFSAADLIPVSPMFSLPGPARNILMKFIPWTLLTVMPAIMVSPLPQILILKLISGR